MKCSNITPRDVAQVRSFDGTSKQSNAFAATTTRIRLVASQHCYIAFGANPTADNTGIMLIANVPEFFGVLPGEKVAALQVSSGGNLSIAEGNV